jgi:pimeloyl-ACP methyl ester carboxylesterase
MRLVFVHGACVRDANWWWHKMVEPLAAGGVTSRAVELPSCRDGAAPLGDLYADVAAVQAAIAEEDGPTVLLGHSYGGIVITEAGADQPNVQHLIYVTSMLPDVGESQASLSGPGAAPWMDPGTDGTIGVKTDSVRELFVNDCDADTAEAAVARLTRQNIAVFGQPAQAAAWREKPSTYVVCAGDLAIPAVDQRDRGARAGKVVEIGSGHHPFLSRPQDFAELLLSILAGA